VGRQLTSHAAVHANHERSTAGSRFSLFSCQVCLGLSATKLYGAVKCGDLSKIALAGNREGSMNRGLATVLGFVAAAVLPAAYLALAYPLSGQHDPRSVLITFVLTYFVATAAAVFFGSPIFLVLNRFKLVRWWSAASCGALVGVIAVTAVRYSANFDIDVLMRYALLGGVAGVTFWIFWLTGRA
jgi:hypothetical protein